MGVYDRGAVTPGEVSWLEGRRAGEGGTSSYPPVLAGLCGLAFGVGARGVGRSPHGRAVMSSWGRVPGGRAVAA